LQLGINNKDWKLSDYAWNEIENVAIEITAEVQAKMHGICTQIQTSQAR